MTNYLSADLHRVLHKQSFLGSVGAFSVLFAVLVFIYFNPSFTAEIYVAKVTSFLSFFPLVIGVFVFLSVYADDFKCRSMQFAIGFGMPRSRIILAKLLESALLLLGAAVAVGVLVLCAPAVLGLAPDARQTLSLALTVAAEMLRALGYLALSAVPVFLSQDAAGGVIAYVLLASKSVYIILSLVLGQEVFTATFGDLTQYLYTAQLYMAKADLIGGRAFALPFAAALLLYIILPAAVSVAGFRKQELEF